MNTNDTHAVYGILAEESRAAVTYSRFYLEPGAAPATPLESYLPVIQHRVLRPLDPSEPDPERSGWCRRGEPFDLTLQADHVFHDDRVVLGMRTDRWAIPPALLRAKVREDEAKILASTGRSRLSRKEKTELREMVMRRLRRQMAPVTRAIDLTWSLDEKLVRFSSHSPKAVATMMDLFRRTFGLTLIPESPYTLAARLGLGEPSAWRELEPSEFETSPLFELEVSE